MLPTQLEDLFNLPAETRAELAMALWESLDDTQKSAELELTEEQRIELQKRLAEHKSAPETAIPWEEARRKLKGEG